MCHGSDNFGTLRSTKTNESRKAGKLLEKNKDLLQAQAHAASPGKRITQIKSLLGCQREKCCSTSKEANVKELALDTFTNPASQGVNYSATSLGKTVHNLHMRAAMQHLRTPLLGALL
jgi:hypothetical protein